LSISCSYGGVLEVYKNDVGGGEKDENRGGEVGDGG
jgi:hypothetical protein